jgi:hypothetical protein
VEGNEIPNFQLTNTPSAQDEKDTYTPDREASGKDDAALLTDYGFIIHIKNPRNPAKRILLAFGLWPPGTQAAIAVILDPRANPRGKREQLRKAIRDDSNVIAVVKVAIKGLFLQEAELVKVREF